MGFPLPLRCYLLLLCFASGGLDAQGPASSLLFFFVFFVGPQTLPNSKKTGQPYMRTTTPGFPLDAGIIIPFFRGRGKPSRLVWVWGAARAPGFWKKVGLARARGETPRHSDLVHFHERIFFFPQKAGFKWL